MVVNLDASGYEGSHWVAIFAPTKREVYYFDSLGAEAPRGAIKKYLKKFNKITTNQSRANHVDITQFVLFIFAP